LLQIWHYLETLYPIFIYHVRYLDDWKYIYADLELILYVQYNSICHFFGIIRIPRLSACSCCFRQQFHWAHYCWVGRTKSGTKKKELLINCDVLVYKQTVLDALTLLSSSTWSLVSAAF
jgi:hypothetical protein